MKIYLTANADIPGRTILLKDLKSIAADLFDGGWRASDKNQLQCEYGLSVQEAEKVYFELLKLEGCI